MNPDDRLFAEKAAKAGVDVEFIQQNGQVHVYPLLPTMIGHEARKEIVERLRELFTTDTP